MPGKDAERKKFDMKKVLAIRTTDRDYAEKLADNLGKSDGNIFEILVFTDEKAYSDYIRQNRIDVLLCDEELFCSSPL